LPETGFHSFNLSFDDSYTDNILVAIPHGVAGVIPSLPGGHSQSEIAAWLPEQGLCKIGAETVVFTNIAVRGIAVGGGDGNASSVHQVTDRGVQSLPVPVQNQVGAPDILSAACLQSGSYPGGSRHNHYRVFSLFQFVKQVTG
jgi:hypothetical protein